MTLAGATAIAGDSDRYVNLLEAGAHIAVEADAAGSGVVGDGPGDAQNADK